MGRKYCVNRYVSWVFCLSGLLYLHNGYRSPGWSQQRCGQGGGRFVKRGLNPRRPSIFTLDRESSEYLRRKISGPLCVRARIHAHTRARANRRTTLFSCFRRTSSPCDARILRPSARFDLDLLQLTKLRVPQTTAAASRSKPGLTRSYMYLYLRARYTCTRAICMFLCI